MVTAPLSHTVLGTNDLQRAESFYAPLLAMLGWRRRVTGGSAGKLLWQAATAPRPLFGVMAPFDGQAHAPGNGAMVALGAPDRATVDGIYQLALASGGSCEGPPGLRPWYHPQYYGAYFRDPDGNKLCVVCHSAPPAMSGGGQAALSRDAMVTEARAWIAAWNRRDIEAVLAGFHGDATFRSPLAERATGVADLTGTAALRAYWHKALAAIETLQFTLMDVICDEPHQTMAVHYEAEINGEVRRACELFRLRDGLKVAGEALYGTLC